MDSLGARMSEESAVLRESASMSILIVDDELPGDLRRGGASSGHEGYRGSQRGKGLGGIGELRGRYCADGLDVAANQRTGSAHRGCRLPHRRRCRAIRDTSWANFGRAGQRRPRRNDATP